MMKRALNRDEKKMIGVAVIVVGGLLGLWFFVTAPARRIAAALESRMKETEGRLREAEMFVGTGGDLRAGVARIQVERRRLDVMFPFQEEAGLEAISDIAKSMHLELISVKPQPKVVFLDSESRKTEIDGKLCQKTAVSVVLRAGFKDLVRYLGALRTTAPVFVDVERLRVSREGAGTGPLSVTLDLNIYSLS